MCLTPHAYPCFSLCLYFLSLFSMYPCPHYMLPYFADCAVLITCVLRPSLPCSVPAHVSRIQHLCALYALHECTCLTTKHDVWTMSLSLVAVLTSISARMHTSVAFPPSLVLLLLSLPIRVASYMPGGTKRSAGSGYDKQPRDRRRRGASTPPPSDEVPLSDDACPGSDEAEPDEEDPAEPEPSARSSPTEPAREPLEAPHLSPVAKKKPKHTGPIRAGHHNSRGSRCVRSPMARPRRGDSGASASHGNKDPPRGSAAALVPRPPPVPPPPGMRNVTLRAKASRRQSEAAAADSSPPPPPPPPEGPTPEQHLRQALAFSASLEELERDAQSMRGRLEDVKYYVLLHCLMLRHEFHLP